MGGSEKMSFDAFLSEFSGSNKKRKELLDKKFGKTPKKDFSPSDKPSKLSMRMKFWRPSEQPTRIRLIPQSEDQSFYTYYQSWVKPQGKPRTVICNDRDGELPVPCLVTYYALKDENPQLLPSKREVITVLVLEEFYKVPYESKQGNTYYKYERSKGVNKFGRSLDPAEYENYEKVFGQKLHWSIGAGHKRQLLAQLEDLSERCGSCKEGFISVYAYTCSSCGGEIANHKEQEISEEETYILRNDEVVCPHCETRAKAIQAVECVHQKGFGSSARWEEGCGEPQKISPWEVNLVVSTSGEGNSTSVNVVDWDLDRSAEEEANLPDWKTTPFDFDYFFQYMDLNKQAEIMGRENPFDDKAQKILSDYFTSEASSDETHAEPY